MGRWSKEGCGKDVGLSNVSVTVCRCYHLTHFAILLSPVELSFPEGVRISLQAIGYVGIGVSMVAMAITIATIIFLRCVNMIHLD